MPMLAQSYTHQINAEKLNDVLKIFFDLGMVSKSSGIFAWYRSLNLSVCLDLGISLVAIDDTVSILQEVESYPYEHSTTSLTFIFSTLGCYFARRSVALQLQAEKNPTTGNMMKVKDANQLAISSINKALLDIYEHLVHVNFFRIK